MINPVRNYGVYNQSYFAAARSTQQGVPKRKISYGHSLGTSALFGLSAMGFSTLFLKGWKAPFTVGVATAGLMMLLSIPDKLYNRQ